MSPFQAFVLRGCACISVYYFRIFDGRLTVYVRGNINRTTLSTHIHVLYHGQDRLCQLSKWFVVAFILCTRPTPSMLQVDGVGIAYAGHTCFSSSMATTALFAFRRDPTAFGSAQDILHVYTSALFSSG